MPCPAWAIWWLFSQFQWSLLSGSRKCWIPTILMLWHRLSYSLLQSVFNISAKFCEIRWFRPPPKFEKFGNNNLNIFKSIFKKSKNEFWPKFREIRWFRPCPKFFDKRNSKPCLQSILLMSRDFLWIVVSLSTTITSGWVLTQLSGPNLLLHFIPVPLVDTLESSPLITKSRTFFTGKAQARCGKLCQTMHGLSAG